MVVASLESTRKEQLQQAIKGFILRPRTECSITEALRFERVEEAFRLERALVPKECRQYWEDDTFKVEVSNCVAVACAAFEYFLDNFPVVESPGILSDALRVGRPSLSYGDSSNKDPAGDHGRRLVSDLFFGSVIWYKQLKRFLQGCPCGFGDCETATNGEKANLFLAAYAIHHTCIAPLPHWEKGMIPSQMEDVQLVALYMKCFRLNFEQIEYIARNPPTLQSSSDPIQIADYFSLPDFLVEQFSKQFTEEEVINICRVSNDFGPTTLRVNTLLATKNQVIDSLYKQGFSTRTFPDCDTAVLLTPPEPTQAHVKPRGSPLKGHGSWQLGCWRNGWVEVQDAGSQMIVDICEARPGHSVLDFCAGNGGKSLALAAHVGMTGQVLCWDVDKRRLKHLTANAERAGAKDIIRTIDSEEEMNLHKSWPNMDVVLCDAVCSSSGTLRRFACNRWRMTEQIAREEMPSIQREILREARKCVKPGGRLVYSTCSLLEWENHDVMRWFESEYSDEFEPHKMFGKNHSPLQRIDNRRNWRLLLPEKKGHDGFFMCVWKRKHSGGDN